MYTVETARAQTESANREIEDLKKHVASLNALPWADRHAIIRQKDELGQALLDLRMALCWLVAEIDKYCDAIKHDV